MAQITIYFPTKEKRNKAAAMLDNAARELGFPTRRAMLDALLDQDEDKFVATMQPLADDYWAKERRRLAEKRASRLAQKRRWAQRNKTTE